MDAQESSSNSEPAAVQEVDRTPATIASLPPEVLESVLTYVSRGDLTKCACVSHYWNQVSTPLIWKVLDAKAFSLFIGLNTHYTQVKQILAKNALYVRELQIRAFGVFDYLFVRKDQQELSEHPSRHIFREDFSLDSAVFTKLRKLSIMFCIIDAHGPGESTLDTMMALISNNPGLTALEFLEEQNEEELMSLVLACADLKEISILFPMRPALAKQVLLQLPESIRKVALYVDTHFGYQEGHGDHLYGFDGDHTDPYDVFDSDYDEFYGNYDEEFYDDHYEYGMDSGDDLFQEYNAFGSDDHILDAVEGLFLATTHGSDGSTKDPAPPTAAESDLGTPTDAQAPTQNAPTEEQDNAGEDPVDEHKRQDRSTTAATPRPHPHIESLWIDGMFLDDAENLLIPFLQTCGTNLHDFRSPDTDCFNSKALAEALIKAGASMPYLEPWHLPQRHRSMDAEIAHAISRHPQLTNIQLQNCEAASSHTAAVISASCKRLQALDVAGCIQLSSTDLISLLSAAGNLFSFSASGVYREESPGDPLILGTDLTACEWRAPQLQQFRGRIKVPRPSKDVPLEFVEESLNNLSVIDCHDIQRSENDETETSFQWYSLELTLQSGLDELAPIKDLEELTVGLMNHRIGIPELEWMKVHWPKFRSLRGLYGNGLDRDPTVVAWIKANAPEWIDPSAGALSDTTPEWPGPTTKWV
ncbi:hypothetical protein CPB97_008955 [Podila verticillata]|nr:hypothetical protein CPB97_008955 [Podila verticillata]